MYEVHLTRKAIIPKLLEELKLPLKTEKVRAILRDFEEYLKEQRVIIDRLSENFIQAVVIGSNAYYVSVDFARRNFYCSCPHNRFRRALCKHVLIVLELYAYLTKRYGEVSEFLKDNERKII
mgnify:CR=1 FL=1